MQSNIAQSYLRTCVPELVIRVAVETVGGILKTGRWYYCVLDRHFTCSPLWSDPGGNQELGFTIHVVLVVYFSCVTAVVDLAIGGVD